MSSIRDEVEEYFLAKYPHVEAEGRKAFTLHCGGIYMVDPYTPDEDDFLELLGADTMEDFMADNYNRGRAFQKLFYATPEDLAKDMEIYEYIARVNEMENPDDPDALREAAENYFLAIYPAADVPGEKAFTMPNGQIYTVGTGTARDMNFIFLQHAKDLEAAKAGDYEFSTPLNIDKELMASMAISKLEMLEYMDWNQEPLELMDLKTIRQKVEDYFLAKYPNISVPDGAFKMRTDKVFTVAKQRRKEDRFIFFKTAEDVYAAYDGEFKAERGNRRLLVGCYETLGELIYALEEQELFLEHMQLMSQQIKAAREKDPLMALLGLF